MTFDKEQVVIWRGKDYKPPEDDGEYPSFVHGESSIDSDVDLSCGRGTQAETTRS